MLDSDTLVNAALVLLFVLIGGVFAGTEMAIVTLRDSQIRKIETSGERGRRIGALVRNPNLFLSAVQIGVTLAGFFSSAYGASTLAPDVAPLLENIGLSASAAATTSFIGMTLVIAYLSLVLGELVPKRLAMQRAVGFTRILAPPLSALATLMRPIIWLLSVSTNAVVRILGGDPHEKGEVVSADEVRDLIASNSELPESSRTILTDVFQADERSLVEVMRPRPDVEFIRGDLTVREGYRFALGLTHSRYPVIGDSTDDILGFVHIRDLMDAAEDERHDETIAAITRPILPLPGSNSVLAALGAMRRDNHQIAVVVDEYGGTDGIITLEDLVEELVGEIYDEYDDGEDPEDSALRRGEVVEVDGGLIVQELESMAGVHLPDGPYETVAGFILDRLDRMAVLGDRTGIEGFELEVTRMRGRRISRVRVTPTVAEPAEQETAGS